VKSDRDPDKEQFQKKDERESCKQRDLFGVGRRTLGRDEIGKEVLDQEGANGNDAGQ
jgi:hypothetical protein